MLFTLKKSVTVNVLTALKTINNDVHILPFTAIICNIEKYNKNRLVEASKQRDG
jgi:hypothetical protein